MVQVAYVKLCRPHLAEHCTLLCQTEHSKGERVPIPLLASLTRLRSITLGRYSNVWCKQLESNQRLAHLIEHILPSARNTVWSALPYYLKLCLHRISGTFGGLCENRTHHLLIMSQQLLPYELKAQRLMIPNHHPTQNHLCNHRLTAFQT